MGRGLYVAADAPVTEHHFLAQACKRVPGGVVCLLSALRFHDLTAQMPHRVWMAIGPKARRPGDRWPLIRTVRFSGKALSFGVERDAVEGVDVAVTSAAKTVADCFKYRNKIGLDIALKALRDYRGLRRGDLSELWPAADVCRVASIIRPYAEALG